jgi:uncharacterized membrane protein
MKNITARLGIYTVLLFSNLLSIILLVIRIQLTHEITFRFLIWNLLLAGIPLAISTFLIAFQEKLSRTFILGCLPVWLLFFPNAPYILTDLYHLYYRANIPLWFDLIMILSFAWNGMMMGFISLMDLQKLISYKFNTVWGWFFTIVSVFLGSFGVYLGRFLRWNSWDIVVHPFSVCRDIAVRFLNPIDYPRFAGVTFFLFFFLLFAYLIIRQLSYFSSRNNTSV